MLTINYRKINKRLIISIQVNYELMLRRKIVFPGIWPGGAAGLTTGFRLQRDFGVLPMGNWPEGK